MTFTYVDNGMLDEIILSEGKKMFFHHMPDKYEKTFVYAIAWTGRASQLTVAVREPYFLGSHKFQAHYAAKFGYKMYVFSSFQETKNESHRSNIFFPVIMSHFC